MSDNLGLILDTIRRLPGRDDDELSLATGVSPRQQVNQLCRKLEDRRQIIRRKGERGKIVNFPA